MKAQERIKEVISKWTQNADGSVQEFEEIVVMDINTLITEALDTVKLPEEIDSHLDKHFFDGSIPEKLTTDKEQRAYGHGYNQALKDCQEAINKVREEYRG